MIHSTAFGQAFLIFNFSTRPAPDGFISLFDLFRRILVVLENQIAFRRFPSAFLLSDSGLEVLRMRSFFRIMERSRQESFSLYIPVSSLLVLCDEICFIHATMDLLSESFPIYTINLRSSLTACGLNNLGFIYEIQCLQSYLRAVVASETYTHGPIIPFSLNIQNDPFLTSSHTFFPIDLFEGIEEGFISRVRFAFIMFMNNCRFFEMENNNNGISTYNPILHCFLFASHVASDFGPCSMVHLNFCRTMWRRVLARIIVRLDPFARPGLYHYFIRECIMISGLIVIAFSDANGAQHRILYRSSNAGSQGAVFPIFEVSALAFFSRMSLNSGDRILSFYQEMYDCDGRSGTMASSFFGSQSIIPHLRPIFAAFWLPWTRYCRSRLSVSVRVQRSLRLYPDRFTCLRTLSSLSAGTALSILSSRLSLTDEQRVDLLNNALLHDRGPPCGRNCIDWIILSNIFDRFSCRESARSLVLARLGLLRRRSDVENMNFSRIEIFRALLFALPFCEFSFISFCSVVFMRQQFLSLLDDERERGAVGRLNVLWSHLFSLFARSHLCVSLFFEGFQDFWRENLTLFENRALDREPEQHSDPEEGPSTSKRRKM
ncbi:hypothetical protein [Candidatus Similichlamydia epinepheli]|uniref:hypothetical protein n=1 Tax=Candidatus Similichlamydia epinepheli TaxID=1903953 RepID=UPI000D3CF7C7|nr:hypothetical protein [Candidatus Similichlamydia epinepheli]